MEAETYPITAAGLQADFARNDQVPFVDVVATLDAQNRQASVLMLNRDLEGERELALEWGEVTPTRVLAYETLTGTDLKAFNTFEQPGRVAPQRLDAPSAGTRMTFRLPPRSYTVAHLATYEVMDRRNRHGSALNCGPRGVDSLAGGTIT